MREKIVVTGQVDWAAFRWIQQELDIVFLKENCQACDIDFGGVTKVFPNGVVPLVVLLEAYRSNQNVDVVVVNAGHIDVMGAQDYLVALNGISGQVKNGGASALHEFSNDMDLNDLVSKKIDQILGRADFAPGVLVAFEWFLNEIAGNILVHANAVKGWLQVVVHPSTKHLAVVVADGGIGIPETIRGSDRLVQEFGKNFDDGDAIEIALRDGITSKPDFGQGKGLTGTMSIVKANRNGRMAITSKAGRVFYAPDSIGLKVQGHQPPFPGTFIDLQMDFDQPLEIEKALWGHVPEDFSQTVYGKDLPLGQMNLKLKGEATTFGNRITGARIRQKIENLLLVAPNDAITIDFAGVSIMASSFADEVFGKLAAHFGVVAFSRRIQFANLNAFCQSTIDDVVQARMAQTYANRRDTRN